MVFRKGTKLAPIVIHELFDKAGLGDNIARIPAIFQHLEQPQIRLHLWVPTAHIELFQYFLGSHPQVKEIGILHEGLKKLSEENVGYARGYDVSKCKLPLHHHTYHKTHLVDHAARMICNEDIENPNYPQIDPKHLNTLGFDLPEKYAVLTVGHTWDNRAFRGDVANQISDYLLEKGITPVFLGKVNLEHNAKVKTTKIDLSKGVNLVSIGDQHKTDLIQAAGIMHGARVVIGVDQGLHHVAGCTPDVPIVCGYTVAAPAFRMPFRRGEFFNVFPVTPDPELECRFCMSRMNINHNFEFCLYKDNKCVDQLTFDKFKQAIDQALEAKRD